VKTIKSFSLILITIAGVASAQAGTVHAGHTTVHTGGGRGNYHGGYQGNYHGNYGGGHGYYGHGYYAHGGHGGRYWRGGYYGGRYYNGGYYPYDSPFFVGLPIPVPFFFPGFN
jgi:hypothetical protein